MRHRTLNIIMRAMALMMVIALAAPASGLGQVVYFCTMTGEVGPKCGCSHEAEAATPDGPSLSVASCCQIVSGEPEEERFRATVLPAEPDSPDPLALPLFSVDEALVQAPTEVGVLGARGPPLDTGPPRYIEHCSFLI